MHDDQTLNDTTPLIRVTLVGAVGGLLVLVIAWLNLWGPLHDSGPGVVPSSMQLMSSAAQEATEPRRRATTISQAQSLPLPKWIWSSAEAADDDLATFRKVIQIGTGLERALLLISCDNAADITIGGTIIGSTSEWQRPSEFDITDALREGEQDIEIIARNQGGDAGLLASIELDFAGGTTERIVTDGSWTVIGRDESAPSNAVELGPLGMQPWGHLAGFPVPEIDRQIESPPGFTVELVYTVPSDQGSWVSITGDDQGRLIASDQANGLFRMTPAPIGAPASQTKVEPIDLPVGAAQGLLCLGDTLYVVTALNYGEGQGFYRVRDTDGDDQYDDWELLRKLDGGGPHVRVEP